MSSDKIAVIGDIHGCYNTLLGLYNKIKDTEEIFSVGDLIDRGRYSKEVVQFCINQNIKPVKGNHEDMMIKAVERSEKMLGVFYKDKIRYYHNGGIETQNSYINSKVHSDFKKFGAEIKSSGHFDYLKNLPFKYEFNKVIISHAGIVKDGNDITILWNRQTPLFTNKLQVFGHTPLQEIIYEPNFYANIDTGCVYKNILTAIIINKNTGKLEEIIQENFNDLDLVL